MNDAELRTFLAIIETGSLVRAANQLNVTQSTVTARLKGLEDEVGQVLLTRHKSGATLTAAGQRLIRYAETIDELWRQARQESGLPGGVTSICNIGCHPDLWSTYGQRFFDLVHDRHPEVAISVWHAGNTELGRWLNNGLTNVSLTFAPAVQGQQVMHQLPTDDLRLYSTEPDSPIKFDPKYIFVEMGAEFGRRHAAAFADADTARVNFGSVHMALDHLMRHGGSAYLPKSMAGPLVDQGDLFELSGAPVFQRKSAVVVDEAAASNWPWLPGVIAKIAQS